MKLKKSYRVFLKSLCISCAVAAVVIIVFCAFMEIESQMRRGIFGRDVYVEIMNFVKDVLK